LAPVRASLPYIENCRNEKGVHGDLWGPPPPRRRLGRQARWPGGLRGARTRGVGVPQTGVDVLRIVRSRSSKVTATGVDPAAPTRADRGGTPLPFRCPGWWPKAACPEPALRCCRRWTPRSATMDPW